MALDRLAFIMSLLNSNGDVSADTYSKEQINAMFEEADDKYLPKSAIVKLDSMEEFNALTEKTADWYFIKEG